MPADNDNSTSIYQEKMALANPSLSRKSSGKDEDDGVVDEKLSRVSRVNQNSRPGAIREGGNDNDGSSVSIYQAKIELANPRLSRKSSGKDEDDGVVDEKLSRVSRVNPNSRPGAIREGGNDNDGNSTSIYQEKMALANPRLSRKSPGKDEEGGVVDEELSRGSRVNPNSRPGAVHEGDDDNDHGYSVDSRTADIEDAKKARASRVNPNNRPGAVREDGDDGNEYDDDDIQQDNVTNSTASIVDQKKRAASRVDPNSRPVALSDATEEDVLEGGQNDILEGKMQRAANRVDPDSRPRPGLNEHDDSQAFKSTRLDDSELGFQQENEEGFIEAASGVDEGTGGAIMAVLADQHIESLVAKEQEAQKAKILQEIPLIEDAKAYVEPKPKPPPTPWYKKPQNVVGIIAAISILIVVIVVVTVVINDDDEEETKEDFLIKKLQIISDRDKLTNETFSQYQAAQWLLNEDPMDLVDVVREAEAGEEITFVGQGSVAEQLIERYVMVLFYFSTGGPFNWTNQFNFLSNSSICDWNTGDLDVVTGVMITTGVDCNQFGLVRQIFLPSNNLVGTLPDELSVFLNLETLRMDGNGLHGTLPASLSRNRNLERITFERNLLTGTLPNLAGLSKLQTVEMSLNLFSGTLPFWLTRTFPDLVRLGLYGNMFTGTIPGFAALIELEWLFLFSNHLTGTIPDSLSQVSNVNLVMLQDNSLTGTIPTILGRLSRLNVLYLFRNKLNGTIPTELGQLPELVEFMAHSNELTGPIPTEINSVFSRLWLQGNNLEGDLTEFCFGDPGIPDSLLDFMTDCLPDVNSTEPAEVTCPCCSLCCNDDAGCNLNSDTDPREVCANTTADLLAEALEKNDVDRGTECTCYDFGKQAACKDTKCMYCSDKDECYVDDGPGIGFDFETGKHFLQIRYVQGRSETISFNYTAGAEWCIPMINGEECNSCLGVGCLDGYVTFVIDCTNLGYGIYSACDVNDDPFYAVWDLFNQFFYLDRQRTLPERFDCVPYVE